MPRPDSHAGLETILRNPAIWRATHTQAAHQGITTAWPALDAVLPERGWPIGMLTELLGSETGAGELALLTPALRSICREGRGIALIAPPYLPHARAWEAAGIALERLLIVDSEGSDLLWAAEQTLRSGECGAVLVWSQAAGRALNNRALQRLQLAAATGNALCFLYRPVTAETLPSPAPLRIRVQAQAGALHLQLVKCRGAVHAKPVLVQPFPAHWHQAALAAVAVERKVEGKAQRKPPGVHSSSAPAGLAAPSRSGHLVLVSVPALKPSSAVRSPSV